MTPYSILTMCFLCIYSIFRTMIITNKAVYHFSCKNSKGKQRKYKRVLRRISIEGIVAITASCSDSNEFAFHIPQEYDTRYKSKYKSIIINVLSIVYKKIEGKRLIIIKTPYNALSSFITTKDTAKKQSKEDKLKRIESYVETQESQRESRIAEMDNDSLSSYYLY